MISRQQKGSIDLIYAGKLLPEFNYFIFNPDDNITIKENTKNLLTLNDKTMAFFNLVVGPNQKAYKNLPFFATRIWDQVVADIGTEEKNVPAVTFGKDKNEKVFTLTNLFSDNKLKERILTIAAGTRSGKGVLTLCIVANALKKDIPIVYLDCKPDMASTLIRLGGNKKVAVLDGLNDKDPTGLIKRTIKGMDYFEYARSTMPESFVNLFDVATINKLINSIAYTRVIEAITKYIQDSTKEGSKPLTKPILLVVDEIQKYGAGLKELMFYKETPESLGGVFGNKFDENPSLPPQAKDYYLQIQNWFVQTWQKFGKLATADLARANITLVTILQEGRGFYDFAPQFLFNVVNTLASKGSMLYGNYSHTNGYGAFASNSSFSTYRANCKASGDLDGNENNLNNLYTKYLDTGKFLYSGAKGIHPLNTCFIVNDGIKPDGTFVEKNGQSYGNLYGVYVNAHKDVKQILLREFFDNPEQINNSNILTTPLKLEARKNDFEYYCNEVLKINGSTKTIPEQLEIGYNFLNNHCKIGNYDSKEGLKRPVDFYEVLYDFDPIHMGIKAKGNAFAEAIRKILADTNLDLIRGLIRIEGNNYFINIPDTKTVVNTEDDQSEKQIEGLKDLVQDKIDILNESSKQFIGWLNTNNLTNLTNLYITQLGGECKADEAKAHLDLFKNLKIFVEKTGIQVPSGADKKLNKYAAAITNVIKQNVIANYVNLPTDEKPFYEVKSRDLQDELWNWLNNVDTIIEGNKTIVGGKQYLDSYLKQEKGEITTCDGNDYKAQIDLIDHFGKYLIHLSNKKSIDRQKEVDTFTKDIEKLKKLRVAAEKEKNGNTNRIAFDSEFNRLLKVYENQEDKINTIKKYALILDSDDDNIISTNDENNDNIVNETSTTTINKNGVYGKVQIRDEEFELKQGQEDAIITGIEQESTIVQHSTSPEVVTAFNLKTGQIKDSITNAYGLNGPMYILETAYMNNLQRTTMKPVELFSKSKLKKLSSGTININDLEAWKSNFMNTFWHRVIGTPLIGGEKVNKNNPMEKKNTTKLSQIQQLYIAKDEIIANNIRVGLDGTELSAEDLWKFDDNFWACRNLNKLYMSYKIAVKAVDEYDKITIDPKAGKFNSLCRDLFKHFKNLDTIIIGDKTITKNDINIDLCKQLDAKLQLDRLTRVSQNVVLASNKTFEEFRHISPRDIVAAQEGISDEKSVARDKRLNKKYKNDNDSYTNGMSSLFGNMRGIKGRGRNSRMTKASPLQTIGNIALAPVRLVGFIFRPLIRLFFS